MNPLSHEFITICFLTSTLGPLVKQLWTLPRVYLCDWRNQWRGNGAALSRGVWPHLPSMERPACHGHTSSLCGCRLPQQLHLRCGRLEWGTGRTGHGGEVLSRRGIVGEMIQVNKDPWMNYILVSCQLQYLFAVTFSSPLYWSVYRRNGLRWPQCRQLVQACRYQQLMGYCMPSGAGPPAETSLPRWRWTLWRSMTLTWTPGLKLATWSPAAVMAGWQCSNSQEYSNCERPYQHLNHHKPAQID